MAVLKPEEYDQSYFDGKRSRYRHNAGYGSYERWPRTEGENSFGEYWKDYTHELLERYDLKGKRVLELGCAKGFVVEDLRGFGADAYGLDVSSYAIGEAAKGVRPYLTIADARTHLANYKVHEFDVVFSLRFLICLSEADLPRLISQMSRISKFQFHVVDEDPNPDFYLVHDIEWWLNSFDWPKGTKIQAQKSKKILTK